MLHLRSKSCLVAYRPPNKLTVRAFLVAMSILASNAPSMRRNANRGPAGSVTVMLLGTRISDALRTAASISACACVEVGEEEDGDGDDGPGVAGVLPLLDWARARLAKGEEGGEEGELHGGYGVCMLCRYATVCVGTCVCVDGLSDVGDMVRCDCVAWRGNECVELVCDGGLKSIVYFEGRVELMWSGSGWKGISM